MLLGWQNQYCENDYITKGNLQIQCNVYQITTAFFFPTELGKKKKTSNLYGNTENPKQPKQSWKRRLQLEESTYLIKYYTTKLQSSRQYSTCTKTEIQTNGARQKAQR